MPPSLPRTRSSPPSWTTDFHWYEEDYGKWRYTVQLDSGEAFKVKLANVRAEGAGGGSGGGKAKGKGKKGKKGRGGRS